MKTQLKSLCLAYMKLNLIFSTEKGYMYVFVFTYVSKQMSVN